MKIFVDFEATQFSEEIISIGAVREDGETFYSLCAPVDGKITPFITNLTGITAEMVKDAMSPNEVFYEFYKWVFNYTPDPEFYTWGETDISFLRHTFKRCDFFNSKLIIGWMCGGIIDYSKKFCKMIGRKHCKLINAYKCINPEAEQTHNSLDDAVMLKEIYNICQDGNEARRIFKDLIYPSPDEVVALSGTAPKWSKMNYPIGTICMIAEKSAPATRVFDSRDDAINYVIETYQNLPMNEEKALIRRNTIAAGLKKATNNNKKWYGFLWREVR